MVVFSECKNYKKITEIPTQRDPHDSMRKGWSMVRHESREPESREPEHSLGSSMVLRASELSVLPSYPVTHHAGTRRRVAW